MQQRVFSSAGQLCVQPFAFLYENSFCLCETHLGWQPREGRGEQEKNNLLFRSIFFRRRLNRSSPKGTNGGHLVQAMQATCPGREKMLFLPLFDGDFPPFLAVPRSLWQMGQSDTKPHLPSLLTGQHFPSIGMFPKKKWSLAASFQPHLCFCVLPIFLQGFSAL